MKQETEMSEAKQTLPIKPPTVDQLRSIAAKHHLDLTDEELEEYKAHMIKNLSDYQVVDEFPEQCLPVKYHCGPGTVPAAADNPYNAWACITNTKGASTGKLLGKTVAIKDCASMAGVPLRVGSTFMEGFVSEYNATVVDRILDEGATIKGKSTCENLCFSGSSFTSASGPVLNAHDTSRSAGGSSSGSAVLIATGAVDMAIGTDQAGSVRLPSCWNGIVGLKPTYGLVPYTGIVSLECFVDHVGPMAKTVKDCALLLEVIAGRDGDLDSRQPLNLNDLTQQKYSESLTGNLAGIRIGVLEEGFVDCEADVEEIVKAAAKNLSLVGATVEEFSSPLHKRAGAIAMPLVTQGFYKTYCNKGIASLGTKGFKDVALHEFLSSASKTKTNVDSLPTGVKNLLLFDGYIQEYYGNRLYAKAVNCLRTIVADFDDVFKKYDVIIMPTIKYKAPKLPTDKLSITEFLDEYARNVDNTIPYNVTGHPAINVNAGFSEGLPVGMMIVGPHWQDDVVLNVAYAVEQQCDK